MKQQGLIAQRKKGVANQALDRELKSGYKEEQGYKGIFTRLHHE